MHAFLTATARRRAATVFRFSAVGAAVGACLGWLIFLLDGGAVEPHILRAAITGTLTGLGVGVGEEVFFFGRRRWQGYRLVTTVRIIAFASWILTVLVSVNGLLRTGADGLPQGALAYLTGSTFVRDAAAALIVATMATAYLEVRRLHNAGEIRRFLLGRYRVPVEEERVFLFADLVGSTALAEALGPRVYSAFISDCFRDVSEAILAWKGQVYQYVGDEIVVSWPADRGLRNGTAVRCFLQMQLDLADRADAYRAEYGHAPRFRAGIHAGPVVTTWVGLAKIELAFHGDALNTAARILALCKPHDAHLLVSTPTLARMDLPAHITATSVGSTELQGRREVIDLSRINST